MDTMINMPVQGDVVPHSPISELRLYSGVPWDDTYEHVRLYESQNELLTHLENWRVATSTDVSSQMSPIRVGEQVVKVPYTEMSMLEINYLAFRNNITESTQNPWVFCFVTSVEWRSEKTTLIRFKLDIFQNNWYKLTLKPCYIEYQHIPKSDDVIGANQIPVNIETGESIVAYTKTYSLSNMDICVYVTQGTTGQPFDGDVVNGVYRTGSLGHYSTDQVDTVNELINAYNDQGMIDSVIAMFMAPQLCINAVKNDNTNKDTTEFPLTTSELFDGYTPKNNKLYSYPFCYALVDNNEGQANVYRFELSNNSDKTLDFKLTGAMCTLPQVMLTPANYKGVSNLYSENLIISGFPLCAYQSDTFKAWIAQNKGALAVQGANIVLDTLTAPFNVAATALSGGMVAGKAGAIAGGLSSGISSVTSPIMNTMSLIGQLRDKSIIPPTVHGKSLSENVNVATGITGFNFYAMCCRREFAEIADSFFEVYGYPQNKVDTPNITSRSSWNYLKTTNCGFTGNVDLDQLKQIRSMCDNGVTFWHTDDVGNYNLTNN